MEPLARQLRRVWHSVPLLLVALEIKPAISFLVLPPSSTASAWRTRPTRTGIFSPHPHTFAIRGPSCSRSLDKGGWADKAPAERWRIKLINGQVDMEVLPEPSEGGLGFAVKLLQPEGSVKVHSQHASSNGIQMTARSLESVRNTLIRQEETIIFALIERGQFRQNSDIYCYNQTFRLNKPGEDDIYGRDASFMEYILCETEKLHATVRRYMSLEEIAFFPMYLPEPILPPLNEPRLLAPNDVNLNNQILKRYISDIVPLICDPGDDEQHGSSVVSDVHALQALSRRVHLGKFVAESKFQEDSHKYQELCRAGDVRSVLDQLENKAVESKVLQRAFAKASKYGRDIDGELDARKEQNFKVDPESIVEIYEKFVIPLTKDVEILYLFQRTGYSCPSLEGLHD